MSEPHLPQLPEEISFASELIKARAELGLTQAQLAGKSGLSLSAIKAYESGRNMPGARELRELCQSLQISPNKLLFGTETPFKAQSVLNSLTEDAAQNNDLMRVRLALLSNLLASDERQAIYTLIHSIAIARHGEKEVKEALLGGDFLAGMVRILSKKTSDSIRTGKPLEIDDAGELLESFLAEQGHQPTK